MIMKNIKRYYVLNAEPKDIYNAITNKTMLEMWTGESVEMEPITGSPFSLWGGSITGINVEFVENRKIVQQWFFGEDDVHSMVTMKLHPHRKGTSLELIHNNIPEEAFENISDGWDEDYFGAMNELFL